MKIQDWTSFYRDWHPEFRLVWVQWGEKRIYCEMWDGSVWWTPDGLRFYWYDAVVFDIPG